MICQYATTMAPKYVIVGELLGLRIDCSKVRQLCVGPGGNHGNENMAGSFERTAQ